MDIIKYQAIEIAIPSGTSATVFYFPDQPQLANAQIQLIETYTITSVSKSPMTGGTTISVADQKAGNLTLYWEDQQILQNMPLLRLNKMVTTDPYVNLLENMSGQSISWTKSYVKFAAAPTGATVLTFGVYYSGKGRT